MNNTNLQQEWIDLSTPWIKESREGRNPTRNGLLDKPMLEACGDLEGLRALDCGCGEGRFCRILAERGVASVLGLDLCEPMVEAANQLASGRDEYRVADVQEMSFLEGESFDLVISYLNQCDLPDYEANNREVYRILKPGGRFVIANLHPMRSAVGTWHRSPGGMKEHAIVDKYFDEGERQWVMMGVRFTNFHRSLTTYVQSYLDAGFRIEGIVEPTITEEDLKLYPELDDEMRVPNFIVFALRKEERRE